jgi:hypothetical protein
VCDAGQERFEARKKKKAKKKKPEKKKKKSLQFCNFYSIHK